LIHRTKKPAGVAYLHRKGAKVEVLHWNGPLYVPNVYDYVLVEGKTERERERKPERFVWGPFVHQFLRVLVTIDTFD